jgi:acyl-homoserine lactone acylase PvdQ
MHDPDQAQSILPVGTSERPDSPYRLSTFKLWADGKLHPDPLSRDAVEKYAASHEVLSKRFRAQ